MRRRFFPQKTNSKYLTIEALENGSISLRYDTHNKIYYRINKGYWTILLYASEVTIEKGQIIECKSLYENINNYGIGGLNITFECKLSGNCLSLIFGDNAQYQSDISAYPYAFNYFFSDCKIVSVEKDFLPATTLAEYCYDGMFYNCTSLTTAPELSATILARYCYRHMFYGCTSLTTAPELPATTLANNCYYSMFEYCTSLVNAPELHATTLANYCYDSMFHNCTNLNYIKMLATDISATACLQSWVNGVSSTGTFVKNINMTSLPVATSSNVYAGIPEGWTVVNDGEESGEGSNLNLVIDYNNVTQNDVDQIINYMIDNGWTTDNKIDVQVINSNITILYRNTEYPINWIIRTNIDGGSFWLTLFTTDIGNMPYFTISEESLYIDFQD